MSGNLKNWTEGEALTATELQRMADDAASADDRVFADLMPPTKLDVSYVKGVYPLSAESFTNNNRLLVVPGSAGKAKVLAARYVVGGLATTPDVGDVLLSAKKNSDTTAGFVAPSVSTRIDVVYVVLQRSTTTASRKVKDPSTGAVTTQVLTVAKPPTVTIGVVTGIEGGGVPTIPADTSSAWYFKLAEITFTTGWAGTVLQSQIVQAFAGGFIPVERVRSFQHSTGFVVNSTGLGAGTTKIDERFGVKITKVIPVTHASAHANWATIDSSIDWRKRLVRVSILRAAQEAGAYREAHLVQYPGSSEQLSGGWALTGDGDAAQTIYSGGTPTKEVRVDTSGNLLLRINAAKLGSGASDGYVLIVEASEKLQ